MVIHLGGQRPHFDTEDLNFVFAAARSKTNKALRGRSTRRSRSSARPRPNLGPDPSALDLHSASLCIIVSPISPTNFNWLQKRSLEYMYIHHPCFLPFSLIHWEKRERSLMISGHFPRMLPQMKASWVFSEVSILYHFDGPIDIKEVHVTLLSLSFFPKALATQVNQDAGDRDEHSCFVHRRIDSFLWTSAFQVTNEKKTSMDKKSLELKPATAKLADQQSWGV